MIGDISLATNIYIITGYTDMRRSIDGLYAIVMDKLGEEPDRLSIYLFCGKRCDRIKGLLWEGTGFLLLYKRLESGSFSWPRTPEEAAEITREQYSMLMMGLNPIDPKIREVHPDRVL